MDRVRFGRALGFGARQAVKTLVTAADAATAENPSAKGAASRSPVASRTGVTEKPAVQAARPKVEAASKRVAQVPQGLKRGGKRFGEAVGGRFVRLSGVLWLEFTGVFFGIFALFALGAMVRLRGDWHATATNAANHRSFLGAVGMLAVFGYFCVSSFVRARRKERGR